MYRFGLYYTAVFAFVSTIKTNQKEIKLNYYTRYSTTTNQLNLIFITSFCLIWLYYV